MRRALLGLAGLLSLAAGCGSDAPAAAPAPIPPERQTVLEVKAYVDARVDDLAQAVGALCEAAPADAAGWRDAARRDAMRARWGEARNAYERVEGAVAILFPEIDQRVDGRYEHAVELSPDPDPFDGRGFTGMHAVERVLWADSISPETRRFEEALRGYVPPRAPSTDAEAARFRDGLCARLVADVGTMRAQLGPLALDHQTAWRGVQGSIEEQVEKVALGATGQDESRYAGRTLADMRANLASSRAILDAYAPLIAAHPEAAAHARAVASRLDALELAYGVTPDGLPPVPEGFDPDAPSPAHAATPYGRLHALLARESDPDRDGTIAHHLREAGLAMGIPPLVRVR